MKLTSKNFTHFTLRRMKTTENVPQCIWLEFHTVAAVTLSSAVTTNFTRIFLKIEFQLTMLINIASVDNLFITELCQWFESQFSNPRVCHRSAWKSPEIKPSTTDEDAECSRRKRILADTFHGCLHSNWIPLAIFYSSSWENWLIIFPLTLLFIL